AQAERALLAETRRLHDAHRMARLGDWQMDLVGGALSGSPEFVRLLGYAPDMPLTWNHYLQHVHSEDRQRISDAWNALLQTGHPLFIEHRLVVPGVPLRHVQLRAEVDAYHEMQRLRGTLMDITEHQHYHDALHKAAHFDALTGLPNRAHFYERLRHQCDDSQQRRTGFALLFIDLDRFKIINDSLGHGAGDELLRLVAERLNETVQGRGFIARLGGDEFALLLARDADMDNVNALAGALVETLAKPFVLLGHPSFITLSIGVARFPDDGTDPETLLRHADLAMYAAKNGGRNNFQYFRADRDKTSPDQVHLESEMHLALERNEFELFYQGQYRASDLQLVGAECLLRWRHPERGLVSPAQFIPLLEETGLIVRTGRWVLEESCRVLQAWQREGLDPKTFSLAVNLSAHQVNREQLMGDITELLDGYGLEPGVLGLELTESSIMQEPARAGQLFRQLRSMGVQIAIDDFGTGYSSLSYLRRFAPDLLKIDRSFVADILKEDKDLEIVTGIIQLAHTLGIEVVAEGVETEAQLARLQSVGCDYVQGFLLARPVPQADFEAMLRERHLIKASR
ncbi:MAG: EAL domain-containing protein, partial [Gammaproteobacteria bacterium]|nr:EAL domain-containing protein [Gammaproteobacteria bacterium]